MEELTRKAILDTAEKCVCGGREHDYGRPENNFATIAKFWNAYIKATGRNELTAEDVAMMMALLKVARIASSGNPDSYADLAGYAACAGELHGEAEADEEADGFYNLFYTGDGIFRVCPAADAAADERDSLKGFDCIRPTGGKIIPLDKKRRKPNITR